MPKTRSFGKPETFFATWHIASSGFETTIGSRPANARATSPVTEPTIFSFVVTRSSRLMPGRARHARGDHDDVGAAVVLVAVDADDVRLVAEDRARLVDVERLALGQALLDVDEHDVGVVAPRQLLRARRADVPAPTTVTFLRSLIRVTPASR